MGFEDFPEIKPAEDYEEDPDILAESYRHFGEEVVAELTPVDSEILDYLAGCPENEWEEFFARLRENDQILRAREDPNVFMEYCFRDKDGVYWEQQEFHREWHELIPTAHEAKMISLGVSVMAQLSEGFVPKSNLTLIGAPREHAKSTQISIGRVIWELGRNPSLRVKVVTAKDKLAKDLIFDIAQNIERNERVRSVFPHLVPDYKAGWTKTAIFVERDVSAGKDPSVEAASVLSSGAGGRADLLLFDDVIDFRNAVSNPALREQVAKAIVETWIPLMPPDGRCIYCATPWHNQDFTSQIRENPQWAKWWKPAYTEVLKNNGKTIKLLLWPTKWTPVALEQRRGAIGPRAFTRQFLLIALSDDEATFRESDIVRCLNYDTFEMGQGVDKSWPRYAGVDLASSMNRKAAWTVVFTIAVDPETNRRYPVEMVRGKLKFPELIQVFVEQWRKHSWEMVLVENNGYQIAVEQQLEGDDASIPIRGFRTGTNKADETLGLPGLATVFSNGGWSIPVPTDHESNCECPRCVWVSELRTHPLGAFSDTVMATWFAERAAVLGGSNFEINFEVVTESELKNSKENGNKAPDFDTMTEDEMTRYLQGTTQKLFERIMWEDGTFIDA